MTIRVVFSSFFIQVIKRLQKKYPHVLNDIQPLILQIEAGQTPGDRLQGLPYVVFKERVKNTDAAKGKRGGYRVIYYVKVAEVVIILTAYSKSEQADVSLDDVLRIIAEYEAAQTEEDDD
jgi:mRNA-degrading endonuclease RelE of RelBE toxin-antitoxin system